MCSLQERTYTVRVKKWLKKLYHININGKRTRVAISISDKIKNNTRENNYFYEAIY